MSNKLSSLCDEPSVLRGAGPAGPVNHEPLANLYPDVGEPPKMKQGLPAHCAAENQGGHEVAGN